MDSLLDFIRTPFYYKLSQEPSFLSTLEWGEKALDYVVKTEIVNGKPFSYMKRTVDKSKYLKKFPNYSKYYGIPNALVPDSVVACGGTINHDRTVDTEQKPNKHLWIKDIELLWNKNSDNKVNKVTMRDFEIIDYDSIHLGDVVYSNGLDPEKYYDFLQKVYDNTRYYPLGYDMPVKMIRVGATLFELNRDEVFGPKIVSVENSVSLFVYDRHLDHKVDSTDYIWNIGDFGSKSSVALLESHVASMGIHGLNMHAIDDVFPNPVVRIEFIARLASGVGSG